jgi:[acyl-carrier-protein] S-malonyltransferase
MSVAAWVDGEPIGADEVDDRLARLRSRDRAGSLPAADSREGRQLRRWVAQVAVVERLCEHTIADSCSGPQVEPLAGRGSANGVPAPNTTNRSTSRLLAPTRSDAAALGSIVAAAWTNNPAVPDAATLVTGDVFIAPERLRRAAALAATDDGGTAWSTDQLLASARLEAFARWLASATHERVRLEEGYEHPGDASQPDNLHEH